LIKTKIKFIQFIDHSSCFFSSDSKSKRLIKKRKTNKFITKLWQEEEILIYLEPIKPIELFQLFSFLFLITTIRRRNGGIERG
jgi:hypothetical protein